MISYIFYSNFPEGRSCRLQKTYGDVDSKFKFVIIASKRAKELLKGAKPKIKSKSKRLIRIAQEEVREGLIDYEIAPKKIEEEHKPEEEFIGEDIEAEAAAEEREEKGKAEAEEKEEVVEKVSKKKGKKS